ncbi:MAG: hypothetical protein H8E11_04420 [Candidatus Cloacimonetes bacterium]|nr:hypothetical protein [Candidatus Cloacimonadota bacterium]
MNLKDRLTKAESELELLSQLKEIAEKRESQARRKVQILRSKIAIKVEVSNDD